MQKKITPFLWFDDKAEEAAEHYVSVLNARPGASGESKILGVSRYGEGGPGAPGTAMTTTFLPPGPETICWMGVSVMTKCSAARATTSTWLMLKATSWWNLAMKAPIMCRVRSIMHLVRTSRI